MIELMVTVVPVNYWSVLHDEHGMPLARCCLCLFRCISGVTCMAKYVCYVQFQVQRKEISLDKQIVKAHCIYK